MNITAKSAGDALRSAILDPADFGRRAVALRLPLAHLWTALLLVAVLNVLMLALFQALSPVQPVFQGQAFAFSPFSYAVIISVFLFLLVFTIYHVGRMMGGQGSVDDILVMVVLFQAISVALEVVQVALLLLGPTVSGLFGLVSLAILVRCVVNFVNVAHEFDSLPKAFLTIFLAVVGTALIAEIVLSVLGVSPTGYMP